LLIKPIQRDLDKILARVKEFGVPTGISSLDDFIFGYRPGNMIVIGGSSSMGKTSFMTDNIIAAARKVPVGVFSIEMGEQSVVDRMIYNMADVNYHRCQKHKTENEVARLEEAKEELQSMKDIFFAENIDCMYPKYRLDSSSPVDSIEIALDEMYRAGARIFFIDYLQLIRWGGKTESEALRLKEVTGKLHHMTLDYSVPIVLLSQLTKATADRATKKDMDPTPTMSDLRDSGYIINDSDIVILLHRPDYYRKKKEKLDLLEDVTEEAHIIIGKQRNGPTGLIKVDFRAYAMSFSDTNKETLF
jgi:replicative DNA helicase